MKVLQIQAARKFALASAMLVSSALTGTGAVIAQNNKTVNADTSKTVIVNPELGVESNIYPSSNPITNQTSMVKFDLNMYNPSNKLYGNLGVGFGNAYKFNTEFGGKFPIEDAEKYYSNAKVYGAVDGTFWYKQNGNKYDFESIAKVRPFNAETKVGADVSVGTRQYGDFEFLAGLETGYRWQGGILDKSFTKQDINEKALVNSRWFWTPKFALKYLIPVKKDSQGVVLKAALRFPEPAQKKYDEKYEKPNIPVSHSFNPDFSAPEVTAGITYKF